MLIFGAVGKAHSIVCLEFAVDCPVVSHRICTLLGICHVQLSVIDERRDE